MIFKQLYYLFLNDSFNTSVLKNMLETYKCFNIQIIIHFSNGYYFTILPVKQMFHCIRIPVCFSNLSLFNIDNYIIKNNISYEKH